jgi:hypothetical protein
MGFIRTEGNSRHASAWAACARPISPPSSVTYELFDMFCALNGATLTPRRHSQAHNAVATQLFPLFDEVPSTASAFIAFARWWVRRTVAGAAATVSGRVKRPPPAGASPSKVASARTSRRFSSDRRTATRM